MKPPKNFYSNLDRRKQGLPEVPDASAADAGKIIKVGENGAYELGEDENTIIIPNPETTPSTTLNTLTIGSTTYKVNEARVTKILGLRFTINNGGDYNANLPQVSLVDIYGNAAVLPVYTMTCDKDIQYGGLTLTGTPGVNNDKLPAAFTVIFNAEFNVEDYPYIKFSKTGLFPQDSAKNLKIEYTLDNENWIEIADLVSIDWTGDSHVYDMSTGEEITTKSPIPEPTAADAGKVLTVDNTGAWELDNVPNELPTVTSADAGKVLTVDNAGAWGADNVPEKIMIVNINASWQITDDLTISDINRVINQGKSVFLRQDTGELFPFVGIGRAISGSNTDYLCFTKTNILCTNAGVYQLNIRTLSARKGNTGKTFTLTQSNIDLTV